MLWYVVIAISSFVIGLISWQFKSLASLTKRVKLLEDKGRLENN